MPAAAGRQRNTPDQLPGLRNHAIDLLRGLAIVCVILNHLGLRLPLKASALAQVLPERFLRTLNYNGYEAVFVFFVISGFLIARHALQRWGALVEIDLHAFYARRASRILPCLLGLVAVLSLLHLAHVHDYVIHQPGQSLTGAVLAALGLHLNWYEARTGYLPGGWDVLWSLSIEEAFYLGFPLLCLLIRRTAVLAPLLLVLALSLPFARAAIGDDEIWLEKAYLPGMAAIAAGILAALALNRWRPSRHAARVLVLTGAIGLAASTLGGNVLWPFLRDGVVLLLTVSTAALLLGHAAQPSPPLRGLRWLESWGRLSYEIYLTHMFVVYAAVRLFRALDGNLAHGWLWYPPVLLLCWVLGALVARLFSMPCERWLRARWLRRDAQPALPRRV